VQNSWCFNIYSFENNKYCRQYKRQILFSQASSKIITLSGCGWDVLNASIKVSNTFIVKPAIEHKMKKGIV